MTRTFFITGAQGCIGAWVVRKVLERGDRAVLFDLEHHDKRLAQVLNEEQRASCVRVQGDVSDFDCVRDAVAESGADAVVHLAGLQVPFCAADPLLGARVNVLGTLNLFETCRVQGIPHMAYASSAAVYDQADGHASVDELVAPAPGTHYGVYKLANEGNARVYARDSGVSSIGLRPLTVYGLGRDQGMTSGPTRALKAASLGKEFSIAFSGATDFLYVEDAAAAFVECAVTPLDGAHVFNLHGDSVEVTHAVQVMDQLLPKSQRGLISVEGSALPIAAELSDGALRAAMQGLPRTELNDGLAATLQAFQRLHAEDRLPIDDLS